MKLRHDPRTAVLIALILTMALVAMDTTILATAVPQVVGDLGGFDQVGWVFSIYLLAQTVTIPIYGKMTDLYGRKPILVIGVAVFLIGSALSAGAWNMFSLIAFRAVQGIGAGAIGNTVQTVAGLLQGGTTWAWGSPASIAVFTVAVVAGVALLFAERRAAEPILPSWLWRRRHTAASMAATATAGMMVIGLSVYLPNWGQVVLGLPPVAAGFVLAAMSITWPLASGISARIYLRIGFRNTALLGGVTAVVAAAGFTLLGPGAPVWQPVACTAVMGAGMGWLFSPLIVGLQNTVGWGQRGTITGGLMFARFLGQSLGAAGFGAVANTVLRHQHDQPDAVAMHAATHAVFVGLLVAGAVSVLLLLFVPRRFPVHTPTADEPAT